MFDFGLSEIALILILGLVVLGPEKLPVAFKTIAQWIKAFRELSQGVKSTLSQELKMHEMQDEIQKLGEITKSQLYKEDKQALREEVDALKSTIAQLQRELSTLSQQGKPLTSSNQTLEDSVEIEHDDDLEYHTELNHSETLIDNCHPPRCDGQSEKTDTTETIRVSSQATHHLNAHNQLPDNKEAV